MVGGVPPIPFFDVSHVIHPERRVESPKHARDACDQSKNRPCDCLEVNPALLLPRPFWQALERANILDRFDRTPMRSPAAAPVAPEPQRAKPSTTPKIGDVTPVREPEVRTELETTYRIKRVMNTGRLLDVTI